MTTKQMTNRPELISFSDPLMIDLNFDQKMFFRPEIEFSKGGIEGLLISGLIQKEENPLIEIFGNVAVLTMEGPLRPGRDWYYSTGYGDIQDAIVDLIGDTRIKTVIQKIDSPGGTVKQAFETHEMFQELAKEKTLIALITGSATSAAALMTFPAKQRFLASITAQTGSIGVVAQHIDNTIWYRDFMGEVRTSVAMGRLKDAGTDVEPYNDKAKEVFEGAVKKLHGIFTNVAVIGLGLTLEKVESQESAVFIGSDGIDQGFADGFASLDELIELSKASTVFSPPGRPAFSKNPMEVNSMDINKLEAEFPDVYKAVIARGEAKGIEASKETHTAEGKAAGILMERKRINDIDALGLPAEQAKAAKESDLSAGTVAANFLKEKAEKDASGLKVKKTEIESELQESLDSDVPLDATPPEGDKPTAEKQVADYNAAVIAAQQGGKVSKGEAMKFVKLNQPELHTAFINHSNKKGE